MKRIFVSACMAFAIFAMVSCSSNPAIKAAEEFIDDPTVENYKKMASANENLSSDEAVEAAEWAKEHGKELEKAIEKCGKDALN